MPKGVSLVWAAGDKRVEGVLDKAIAKTMSRIESYAQARVRLGSGDNQMDEQRDTGNLVWVGFTHETARPVRHPDGEVTVDPHLHRHVFVHNLTYDPVEERWKAMKNRAMFERTAYFQEIFESYLARFVHELGYRIDRRGKLWDIADVSPELAARYSLRTKEVNDYAEEKGITNAAVKGELGARSRSVKSLATDVGDIADHFRDRSLDDFDYSERLRVDAHHRERFLLPDGPLSPRQRKELLDAAVDYALERAFERRSTAYAHMVLADAIRFAGAGRCLPEEVQQALLEREGLIFGTPDGTHRQLLTTNEIVEQERSLLKVVRDRRNAHLPLVLQPRIDRQLSPEQMAAVTHVLSSTDGVMSIRGQAGVGKSFLLKSLVKELDRNNISPVALAPTVSASRGALRKSVLSDANTLAMFMSDSEDGRALREKAKDSVVVLDEAGLTSTPDMLRFMEKATELNARVLLVGDTGQLSSVERGDALRLLERDGLIPAELKHIRRQTNKTYRAVVEKMATGQAAEGLEKARTAGFVTELSIDFDAADDQQADEEVADRAAAELAAKRVAEAYDNGHSNIVVAPTHALGRVVTAAIRAELQAKGHIGKDEAKMTLLRQVDLHTADRRDATHALEQGDLVVMRRDDESRGLSMGEVLHAKADRQGKVRLYREDTFGSRVSDGLDPRAYGVYRSEEIPIAVGDQVRAFEPMADMATRRSRHHRKHRSMAPHHQADRWARHFNGFETPRARVRGDGAGVAGAVRRPRHRRRDLVVSRRDVQRGHVRRRIPRGREARYHHGRRRGASGSRMSLRRASARHRCRERSPRIRDLPEDLQGYRKVPADDEIGLSHRREQEPALALVGASAGTGGAPSADAPEQRRPDSSRRTI